MAKFVPHDSPIVLCDKTATKSQASLANELLASVWPINLIHDTRLLCTRLRTRVKLLAKGCNNSQRHATTYNRVCKQMQHFASNNVVSVCTGLNGIKAMSGGFSGEKQVIKFAYVRKRGRVCLFYPTEIDNGKL